MSPTNNQLVASLGRIVSAGLRASIRVAERISRQNHTRGRQAPRAQRPRPTNLTRRAGRVGAPSYPGDFRGRPDVSYNPQPGETADPGEVVWTWVPYEEDHSRGKDRPVLLIGRDGQWLLGLPLTSKDHDRDEQQKAREGRHWADVGTGPWDRSGRPSEARLDRIVRVDPDAVRRVGGVLPRDVFDDVIAQMENLLS
ncbi:type II toxin-antitoxin system PemK/MazF family toxin [Nigerium massiliense]|uniref:type II toxin-antitoxin system PemK/MazF family toxin n=1 Tax=Nigerium massiliense TaxID=1522317 RepID=UPI00058BD429|nr:type II toxin-antitoxin system PemK/MazF family toxin [Nigerium massiliense]